MRILRVTQFPHRTTPSVFSPDPKSFLIFKHKFLMNFFLFRPYFLFARCGWKPLRKIKDEKTWQKAEANSERQSFGQTFIYLLQQARDITRAFGVRTMAKKYLAMANESSQFPEAKRRRNWMVETNLIYLNFSRHLTLRERKSTGIDWATKSARREKYKTGK